MLSNIIIYLVGAVNICSVLVGYYFVAKNVGFIEIQHLVMVTIAQTILLIATLAMLRRNKWGYLSVIAIYCMQIPVLKNGAGLFRLNMTLLHLNFWFYYFAIDILSLALVVLLIIQHKKFLGLK